ncbi:MAG TPA: hypothetical protein PKD24_07585 [Pyrinomonadaceae bacterium]|nr:hypothetical protein [Pyrinomonadaceae bacterium]
MDVDLIRDVIEQYSTHGWKLRRVLAVDPGELNGMEFPEDVAVSNAGFNALWFSRRSRPGSETWELRRADGSPFALLTTVPNGSDVSETLAILAETEQKMLARRN